MNDSRDINTTTTAKNVKKTITIVSTAIIVAIVSFSTTSSSISLITTAVAQQTGNTTTTPTTPTTITLTENVVQVNATETNEVYRWQINGQTNPDLRLLTNTAYTFTVQNPTDTKHELIIADSQGKELATSGDIQPGASGILNFKTNMTSSGGGNMLGYHCEYHPDLMKGAIQIVNQ
jgi:hypothetical protein